MHSSTCVPVHAWLQVFEHTRAAGYSVPSTPSQGNGVHRAPLRSCIQTKQSPSQPKCCLVVSHHIMRRSEQLVNAHHAAQDHLRSGDL
jgi:hypothetical protein